MKIIRRLILSALVTLTALGLCVQAEGFLLPDSLEAVEEEAFCGTEALDEVTLPEGVLRVESRAFAQSSLTRIGLSESLEYIAPDTFEGCRGLIAWGEAYSYAQEYCEANGIPFECGCTDAGLFTFTFSGTTATLTGYNGSDPVVSIPPMADETHVITAIGSNAFKGKTGLTAVRMPYTVTKIGSPAFNGLRRLDRDPPAPGAGHAGWLGLPWGNTRMK